MNAIRLSARSVCLSTLVPLALALAGCGSPALDDAAASAAATSPTTTSTTASALLRSGPITWRQLDSASFDDGADGAADQQRLKAILAARAGNPALDRAGVGRYSATVRVDRAGRRWIVDAVDWDALIAKRAAALGRSSETDTASASAPDDSDDDGGYDVPLSWSGGTCNSGSLVWATWNGDDRVSISAPTLTDRQKTVVTIVSGMGNIGCSGVLVDNQWVLTAAHCVTGPSGGAHNPATTTVTVGGNSLYDNFEQVGVVDIVLDGSPWNGNTKSDYALLELDTNVGDTNGYMLLSVATDATVTGNPLHNLAFPPHRAPVSSCIATSLMTHLIEDAKSVSTSLVKTYFDVESGHSGSPIYYCPQDTDNFCAAGETGYVIAVMTAIHYNIFGTPVDTRGPRVKNFQPWASGLLPSQ